MSWISDSPEDEGRLPKILILLLLPTLTELDLPTRGLRGLERLPSDELRLRRGLAGGENVDKKFMLLDDTVSLFPTESKTLLTNLSITPIERQELISTVDKSLSQVYSTL